MDHTEDNGFIVGPDTQEAEFRGVVQAAADPALEPLTEEDLHDVFVTVCFGSFVSGTLSH
jgi:hypothetical protein